MCVAFNFFIRVNNLFTINIRRILGGMGWWDNHIWNMAVIKLN